MAYLSGNFRYGPELSFTLNVYRDRNTSERLKVVLLMEGRLLNDRIGRHYEYPTVMGDEPIYSAIMEILTMIYRSQVLDDLDVGLGGLEEYNSRYLK